MGSTGDAVSSIPSIRRKVMKNTNTHTHGHTKKQQEHASWTCPGHSAEKRPRHDCEEKNLTRSRSEQKAATGRRVEGVCWFGAGAAIWRRGRCVTRQGWGDARGSVVTPLTASSWGACCCQPRGISGGPSGLARANGAARRQKKEKRALGGRKLLWASRWAILASCCCTKGRPARTIWCGVCAGETETKGGREASENKKKHKKQASSTDIQHFRELERAETRLGTATRTAMSRTPV